MIKLWKRLGMPGQTQFASALGLAALSGASAVFLLGLSGWFLTAQGSFSTIFFRVLAFALPLSAAC